MVYLLFYYRALGMVAVVSLILAAIITYFVFVILGRQVGLALTLASVAGAIVAIGITADSFVVHFERIRDEIRGRSLRAACDAAGREHAALILAADFVSFPAAVILVLPVGRRSSWFRVRAGSHHAHRRDGGVHLHPSDGQRARAQHVVHQRSPADRSGSRRLGVTSMPGQTSSRTGDKVEV